MRTAWRYLSEGCIRELPHLVQVSAAGQPRVYGIALETIAHGDGRVDAQSLGRFVPAYRTVTARRIGELWAIPIMLLLAVIGSPRRTSVVAAGAGAPARPAGGIASSWNRCWACGRRSTVSLVIDGIAQRDRVMPLVDGHHEHPIEVSVPVRV